MSPGPGRLREARDVAREHLLGHRHAQCGAECPEDVMDTGRVGKSLAALADGAAPALGLRPVGVPALRAALALLPDAVEHSPNIGSLEGCQSDLAELRRQVQPHRDLVPDVGRRFAPRFDDILKNAACGGAYRIS